jgi:AraC-like DNA-binding protein
MDTLSEVLRAVRLTGAVFYDIAAADPWVIETPAGATIVSDIFPGTEHLIPYHMVASGSCWAWAPDQPPAHLSAGDVIVFPHGDAHVLSSAPGMRGLADPEIYRRARESSLPFRVTAGDGASASTQLICGYLGCDARPFNPLLSALPRVLKMSDIAGGALSGFFAFAVSESRAPRSGSDVMLGRLSELMFIEVIRRFVDTLPAERGNWLAGLRDPSVGAALSALHGDTARDWSLASLAHEVGVSRSVLAERFMQFVGQPPMQYLMHWRMQLAANQLRNSNDSVAEVAELVGYESEAAFSRAFKKVVGAAPSDWRKQRRN